MGSIPTPISPPATPQCARAGCTEPAAKCGESGPPRRYCSNACRQAAYRDRRRLRQANPEPDARDVIGDAVAELNEAFAALPGPTKRSRYGEQLMKLALALDRYHRGVLD